MQAEYTVSNNRCHWQVVEGIRKVLPHIGISVFSQTLIIKAVYLGNLTTLVIATENRYTVTVPHFESDQESDSFQGVVPSVDVISHKQVVGFGTGTANAKELS